MSGWRQTARDLADSPHLERDLATLLSAWRLAVWYSALVILILATLGIGLLVLREGGEMSARLGLGEYLAALQFLAVAVFLTVFVPLRCSGGFEGPRWQRYFDQVVLSGISPVRYLAGKVLAANIFFGAVMLATVPFMIFTASLGGVGAWPLLTSVVALWLYANVLVFATLAAGVSTSELLGTAAVVGLFGFLFVLGLFPLSPLVGLWCPAHLLAAPFYAAAELPEANELPIAIGDVTVGLGSLPIFGAGAGVLIAFAAVLAGLGPLRCFTLATSTFGEVVMRGDSRRSRFARNRPALQRRAELCFFYENRPAWLDRLEVPLRWGSLVAVVVLVGAALFVLLHANAAGLNRDEVLAFDALICGVLIGSASVVFANDRSTEKAAVAWGARRWRAGAVDTVAFVAVATVILAAAFALPAARAVVSGGAWPRGGGNGPEPVVLFLALWPLAGLYVAEYYALVRLFSMSLWSRFGGWLAASAAYGLGLVLVPFVLGAVLSELPAELTAVLPPLRPTGAWLAMLSPLTPALTLVDPHFGSAELRDIRHWGLGLNVLLHVALFATFALLAVYRYRRLDAWEPRP